MRRSASCLARAFGTVTPTSHPTASKSVKPGARIGFVTDVEGNLSFWRRYVAQSQILYWEDSEECSESLRLRDGCEFVYGGDTVDRGLGDLRVKHELLALKRRYPDRVHFILGNRDINKLRLLSELQPHALDKGVYWVNEAPDSSSAIAKLKWMLTRTMGCPHTFEYRRLELAQMSQIDSKRIGDGDVFDSFLDMVSEGGSHWEYLQHAHLALRINDTLFIHGAIDHESYGYIPPSSPDEVRQPNSDPNSFVDVDVIEWTQKLEQFKLKELEDVDSNRRSESVWGMEGGYENRAPGGRLMQYGMGRCPPPKRLRTRSVVYNDFLEKGCPKYPDGSICASLGENGIRRLVSGHKPHGDAPLFIRCPKTDLMICTGDTSYSSNVIWDGSADSAEDNQIQISENMFRGDVCTNEILLMADEYGGTNIVAHGTVSTGEKFVAITGEDMGNDNTWLGRATTDGWWIKGRILSPSRGNTSDFPLQDFLVDGGLKDSKLRVTGDWLLTKSEGFNVRNRIAGEDELDSIVA